MCKHTLDLLCVLSGSCRSMQSFLGMLIKSWTFSEYFSSAPAEDFKIGEHGGELRTRCILCENPVTLYTCAPLIKDKQMLLAEILYDHCPGILVLIFHLPSFLSHFF